MSVTAQKDHYLPDAIYNELVERLLTLPTEPSLCPRSSIKELLGEVGGIWPDRTKQIIRKTA